MIVSLVPPAYLQTCMKEILPFLERAVATSDGRYEVRDVVNDIVHGDQLLWVCFEIDPIRYYAICTTKLTQYPKRKMVTGVYVSGDDLGSWRDPLLDTLEKFAREQNADGIEMVGRTGWKRALADRGWRTDYSLFEYDMRV